MNDTAMTDSALDPDALREAARRLLAGKTDRRAAYADTPGEAAGQLRASMAELGWTLLTVPESHDGLGQSFEALAPIYEEMGRALCPVALAPTMAAVDVLAQAGTGEAGKLLGAIGSGEAIFSVALAGGIRFQDGAAHGVLRDVADAPAATHLLLVSYAGDTPAAVIDFGKPGVAITAVPLWDRSRTMADIELDGAACHRLAGHKGASHAGVLARAHLDLAAACDSIGGADAALADAIAYMGTRKQFDRPIGSFQALKHRAADLKVGLEVARAFVRHACAAFAGRRGDWDSAAGQARLIATEAYRAIAEESVQFHGGIGFTWEHDCHLFLKRALLNEMLGDPPEAIRDRIAPAIFRRAGRPGSGQPT